MSPRHIYNRDGYWVAFIVGDDVFDRFGDPLGCLVNGQEIYGANGDHLGTLTHGGHVVPSDIYGWTSASRDI
jgi:hypothetical protein